MFNCSNQNSMQYQQTNLAEWHTFEACYCKCKWPKTWDKTQLCWFSNLYASKCNSEICNIVFTSNHMKRLDGTRVSTFIYEYIWLAFANQFFYIEVAIIWMHRDGHYKPEGNHVQPIPFTWSLQCQKNCEEPVHKKWSSQTGFAACRNNFHIL